MSSPFDTLTQFSQNASDQVDFFDDIKTILNQLEGSPPIIIESTTVPTQVQMETLYLAAGVGRSLPVPTSQEFIWTNQGIVQGEYRTLDDLFVNINDTNVAHLSPSGGMTWLMANGDLIASGLSKADGSVTAALKKFDRRTGNLTDITGTMYAGYQFSANPAGTHLAVTKLDGGGIKQIYTVPYPAMTPFTQLTTSTLGAQHPHWVGTKISYLDNLGGNFSLRIMDDNGANQTTVLALGIAGTSVTTYQQLSPDRTKLIYTKANATKRDVFMVNVNGTGNVKFIDSSSSTDNPKDEMYEPEIPSWHPSGNWVYMGRQRKHIITNEVEQWFTYHITPPDSPHTLTNPIVIGAVSSLIASEWFNKNLSVTRTFPYQYTEDQLIYVPTYSNFSLSGQVIITPLSQFGSTIITSKPILMIASEADGYTSTGKIYKTSQYVPDRSDFELIRQDVAVGGETTYSLTKAELENFSHILLILSGQSTVGGATSIKITFNEDTTAGDYQNTNILATTAIVRAYQTLGDDAIYSRSSGGANVNSFATVMFMPEIDSTDSFKNVFSQMIYTNSVAAFAIANYLSGDTLGIWKSIAAVESIRFVISNALAAGTTFTYYGLRGVPRNERDI